MRQYKRLILLMMAFLFAMTSCGDDEFSIIESQKDDPSQEDSLISSGSDASADSKSRSSSSIKDYSSSSSLSVSHSSSSRIYEDLPGKVITGEYQGFLTYELQSTIKVEVRELTDKLEYVDSTVAYHGRIELAPNRIVREFPDSNVMLFVPDRFLFDVRGLPDSIEYAEILIKVIPYSNGKYVNEYAIVNLKGVDSLFVNSAMNFIYKRIKYLVSQKGLSFAEAKAKSEKELQKIFYADAEFHDLEKINVLNDKSEGGLWAAAIATTGSSTLIEKMIRAGFKSDAYIESGTLIWNDSLANKLASAFYNCDDYICLGHIYSRHRYRALVKANLIKFFDIFSRRGTCTTDRRGEVTRIGPDNYFRTLTCDGTEWRLATIMERDMYSLNFPDCGTVEKTVMGKSKHEYYCNGNGKWIDAYYWSIDVPLEYRLNPNIEYGTMTDQRDGKIYRTTKIGNKVWMAQNLDFKGYANKEHEDSMLVANLKNAHICYSRKEENCDVCGCLYNWAAAMNINESTDSATARALIVDPHQGVCPDGWHIPSSDEFRHIITDFNNGNSSMGDTLKARQGWGQSNNDPVGFAALPCGRYMNSSINMSWTFDYWGYRAFFMATSNNRLLTRVSISTGTGLGFYDNDEKNWHVSIRCVKND
ncbi:MAG: hypothetical protein GX116_00050 [Fibrobacter sp.]|jgi:uncharacterized protein (TIGR02145 family)|nr:hypothetical protein [Fibrobacter sp.]